MNNPAFAPLPWPVAFSFGRAIQQPALSIWDGQDANVRPAQQALLLRSEANRNARLGEEPRAEGTAR